ncbi:MAG: hypothetical protein WBM07_13805 [Chitinivibrionales bacterium]
MEQALIKKVLDYCKAFLVEKKNILYDNCDVLFTNNSYYTDYDRMLKREIVYTSFNVYKILCECKIAPKGSGIEIQFTQDDSSDKTGPATKYFLDFLREQHDILLDKNMPNKCSIATSRLAVDLFISTKSVFEFSMHADLLQLRSLVSDQKEYSATENVFQFFQQKICDWLSHSSKLQTTAIKESTSEELKYTIIESILFSQIDVDSSAEDVPSVFRWQETQAFGRSASDERSLQECTAILTKNIITPPANGVVVGKDKFEIDERNSCLLVRYAHHVKDNDFHNITKNPLPGLMHKNAGFIIVENDFWEFYIDCSANKVISENKKWRNVQ